MFIHNFCRLREGVNPIHPATASWEANVTYTRFLLHLGVQGVPILCFGWIFLGVGWLGTHFNYKLKDEHLRVPTKNLIDVLGRVGVA